MQLVLIVAVMVIKLRAESTNRRYTQEQQNKPQSMQPIAALYTLQLPQLLFRSSGL
jgi:hypothetical protein